MPSLKEVKTRINSVNSTRKITSAMKMVASAKLHAAQRAIEGMHPYEQRLTHIMKMFLNSLDGDVASVYSREPAEVKRVAIVLLTSNTSLCGAFNGNAIKEFRQKVDDYRAKGIEVAAVHAIGKKGAEAVGKLGLSSPDYSKLLDQASYEAMATLAHELMAQFEAGEIDRVELIYHKFISAGTQQLRSEQFLPMKLEKGEATYGIQLDYIVEPGKGELIEQLIPKALCLKLFTVLLDSLASEHATRVIAMQVATDNANELLEELTLLYNKSRQQAITAELLDIVGGSMA